MQQGYAVVTGTNKPVDGSADKTIIAAQGAGKKIYLMKAVVSVTVAAVGGTGEVALEDGVNGTRLFEADADAVGSYSLDFGEDGYPLTANTLLNATVDGAGTTQASARVTAVARVV
jgi:hypothetical protein